MARYQFDLPFYLPLDEGAYRLNVAGLEVGFAHSVVERADLDPRLGGVSGSFGLERDQLGVLRFSRLVLELDQQELEHLGATFFSDAQPNVGPGRHQDRARVALAACNDFLDRFRVAARKSDVRPLGPWDLALVRFEDGNAGGDLRLYGGGITLPPSGLSPEFHERVLARLAGPEPPAAFEAAAVDALRGIADGRTLESIVTAIGALEAALDLYFGRSWRLQDPPLAPRSAAREVGVGNTSDVYTAEDALAKTGVRAKVTAYAAATGLEDAERDGLYSAIDLRNLAVHAGVRVSQGKAQPHVETLAGFVLDHLAPAIRRECPALPRAEFLYACQEALGSGCTPELQRLVDDYLAGRGLAGRLLNHRFERRRMESERYGDTVVLRVSFRDFDPADVALFVARALLHHALARRSGVATARPADQLPFEEARPFWQVVASELTRAGWGVAIDRRLAELGFEPALRRDIERQVVELQEYFAALPAPPGFHELAFWVDYLRLAWVSAWLTPDERRGLLAVAARTAPDTARRAAAAAEALEAADYDDPGSIRNALVGVHDAHEGLLATVSVYDPVTRARHGRGLRFEDIF